MAHVKFQIASFNSNQVIRQNCLWRQNPKTILSAVFQKRAGGKNNKYVFNVCLKCHLNELAYILFCNLLLKISKHNCENMITKIIVGLLNTAHFQWFVMYKGPVIVSRFVHGVVPRFYYPRSMPPFGGKCAAYSHLTRCAILCHVVSRCVALFHVVPHVVLCCATLCHVVLSKVTLMLHFSPNFPKSF